MAGKTLNRALSRGKRARQLRRRRLIEIGGIAVGAVALAILALALLGGGRKRDVAAYAPVEPTAAPALAIAETAEAAAMPAATTAETAEAIDAPIEEAPASTAEPVHEATEAPTPQPTDTPAPGSRPDVVSFYTPKGKSNSARVRMGDVYSAPWKKGKDIGSFEVIASDEALLDGTFFGDIFGAAWKQFPEADLCKIGYTLRYTLYDGTEIHYSMLSPKHIEHTEYIEVWLYDDYHREPHQFYSHLKSVKSDTLMTSIKLTAGSKINDVTDIWLTAFVCSSLDEFDANRNYIGRTSCSIHIVKE